MTEALYTGRAMLRTAVIERGFPGGELLNTEYLDDVIGFPKILGYELAEKFAAHAKQFGAEFFETMTVTSVPCGRGACVAWVRASRSKQ